MNNDIFRLPACCLNKTRWRRWINACNAKVSFFKPPHPALSPASRRRGSDDVRHGFLGVNCVQGHSKYSNDGRAFLLLLGGEGRDEVVVGLTFQTSVKQVPVLTIDRNSFDFVTQHLRDSSPASVFLHALP